VADPSLAAARLLRVLLAGAVALLVPGIVLPGWTASPAMTVAGLWTLALSPFVVLTVVSAGETRTRWFAAATVALLIAGLLLAR
jgi:hypothetical protein